MEQQEENFAEKNFPRVSGIVLDQMDKSRLGIQALKEWEIPKSFDYGIMDSPEPPEET